LYIKEPKPTVTLATQVTVEVLALSVILVVTPVFHAVPAVAVKVIVEAPKVKVLVLLLLELKAPHEQACPLVSRVPLVRVSVLVAAIVKAADNCQTPVEPVKVMFPKVFPPLSIDCSVELVDTNLNALVSACPLV
jgi:hypothetical protein